jgi:hypothetical protein
MKIYLTPIGDALSLFLIQTDHSPGLAAQPDGLGILT